MVLFAIPVAVFVFAFFVGWLIHHIGIINTIIIGMILSVLAGLFQVFFTEMTSLWYIIISFLILGGMWALGNTVSIIAGQAAVDKSKTSAATGTIVTMFNVGGSIGLAISVVIFNWMSHHFLKNIAQANFTEEEMMHLQQSVDNPMHSLQIPMTDTMHSVFNSAFMYGFTKVMWFLFFLSAVVLISVILGKVNKKGESA